MVFFRRHHTESLLGLAGCEESDTGPGDEAEAEEEARARAEGAVGSEVLVKVKEGSGSPGRGLTARGTF